MQIDVFEPFDLCRDVGGVGAVASLGGGDEGIDVPVRVVVEEVVYFFSVEAVEFGVGAFETFVSLALVFDAVHVVLL